MFEGRMDSSGVEGVNLNLFWKRESTWMLISSLNATFLAQLTNKLYWHEPFVRLGYSHSLTRDLRMGYNPSLNNPYHSRDPILNDSED